MVEPGKLGNVKKYLKVRNLRGTDGGNAAFTFDRPFSIQFLALGAERASISPCSQDSCMST